MFRLLSVLLTLVIWLDAVAAPDCFPQDVLSENLFPALEFVTSKGTIVVELNRNRAPATVNNFLRYVLDGHYNNTIFHRVIPEFVVQGGGYTPELDERPLREPVINESGNGLSNRSGSIAMARYNDPHSATSQFFFNLKDNDSLNPNARSWGYTVFGDVIEGFEVVEAISAVETGYSEGLDTPDVPVEPVILIEVRVQN
jgi:peptidyl-prolyl cis-trans isomerase A (cyclophilin A)